MFVKGAVPVRVCRGFLNVTNFATRSVATPSSLIFEEHGETQVSNSAKRAFAFAMDAPFTVAGSYTKYLLGVAEA